MSVSEKTSLCIKMSFSFEVYCHHVVALGLIYVNCVLILMSVVWNCVKDSEAEVDVDMIAKLVEDTLYATQPAMILNLRACVSSPAVRTHTHTQTPFTSCL